jgi:uncharacterized iron-regulated protein
MKSLAFPFLLMPFLGFSQLSETHYKIFDSRTGAETTVSAMVSSMATADVLIFGEQHNDSVAHFLQLAVLTEMHRVFGKNVALSMEMFDRDVQVVMDQYLSGFIREKHFKKDARAWSNYRDYRPMVELAKEKGLKVICANAASRYSNFAGREGQAALQKLNKEAKSHFAPLPYRIAQGAYKAKLEAMMGHGEGGPAMMGGFDLITAQSLWDATMAYSIAEFLKKNKGKKVLQLNGRFHSDERFAIVEQLKHYAPKLRVLVISCFPAEGDFRNPDWSSVRVMGDFVILTDPEVPKTYE